MARAVVLYQRSIRLERHTRSTRRWHGIWQNSAYCLGSGYDAPACHLYADIIVQLSCSSLFLHHIHLFHYQLPLPSPPPSSPCANFLPPPSSRSIVHAFERYFDIDIQIIEDYNDDYIYSTTQNVRDSGCEEFAYAHDEHKSLEELWWFLKVLYTTQL